MRKYDVICPFCIGVFLETNERFDSNRPANGSMFTAKQHIVDAGWSTFPLCDSSEYANVVCPSCDQTLLDSAGRVIILKDAGEIPEQVVPATPETIQKVAVDMALIIEKMMAEYEPELPSGLSLTVKLNAVNVEDSGLNPVGHSSTPVKRKAGRPKR